MRIPLMFFVFAFAAEALAYSPKQDQLLDHIAEAYVISDVCNSLHFPINGLATRLRAYRLDNAEAIDEIKKRADADPWGIRQNRPDMACLLGEMYYGSNGTKWRGMLTTTID